MPKFELLLLVAASAALSGCVTPGVTAAVHRDPDRLRAVLARPNHGGEDLSNLLSNSIAFDCAECVRVLLNAGAKAGAEPLCSAALAGQEAIARLLIEGGADPAAAIAVVHAQTRKWAGGSGLSPQESQGAIDLLKKIERERAAKSDEAAPAVPPASAPVVAAKAPTSRSVPSFREKKRADDYALVVGVETYESLPAAAYAERDAEAAADFMKALGVPSSNLVTLTGVRATRAGLAKNLEGWLADDVNENSTVYLYFAGRGARDPKSGRAYLVPSDGDPRYLELTAYPLKRLYEKLGEQKLKRAIVILDADFSGGADDGFNSANGKIALLTAADGDQVAGTNEETGYGLFTGHLFDGLNGAAKDASGQVTLKALSDYLKSIVAEGARRAGRRQDPQFESGGTATDSVVLRTK